MDAADQPRVRSYVTLFGAVAAAALAIVAALNYLVDPYLLHQWDSPLLQRLRPTHEKLSVWGKTYAVARYRPAVVYIGNSRTEMGLSADADEVFPGQSVFNSAVSGASIGDAMQLARHAARVSRIDTMVWGLDAPSFSMEPGSAGIEPGLLEAGPAFFVRRALLNIKRSLTLDMTQDTLRLLSGSYGQICRSSLALYGQRDQRCVSDRIHGWGGTAKAMIPRLQEFGAGAGPTPRALQAFDATVGELCRSSTHLRLRLYINPTHAMTMDVLYYRGRWADMERWQGDLAALAERYRQQGCDVRVHDFSGFNSITSEAIPQFGGGREMQYYWEASHYRDNVGRMILARLFGGEAAPDDFGVELTPTTLPAHQQAMRAARDARHASHPQQTAFVQHLLTLPRQQP